jgi:hypothetical protein
MVGFFLQNPFDSVSAEELEEYKRIISRKEKGEESPTSPRDDTIADTMGDTTDPGTHSYSILSFLNPIFPSYILLFKLTNVNIQHFMFMIWTFLTFPNSRICTLPV